MLRCARWPLLLALTVLSGCAGNRLAIENALRAKGGGPGRDLEGHYVIRCPDALEVTAPLRPEAEGVRVVRADGSVVLAPGAEIDVGGLTAPEASRVVARCLGCEARCRVTKHESQQVFLLDPRGATQRAVAYRGPETVVEFLRRAGGLDGAALERVQVVRAHVADGQPAETFDVDLAAILLRADAQTDIRLMPFDRVYVAQTKRWRLAGCLPPWMRPMWRKWSGEPVAAADPP